MRRSILATIGSILLIIVIICIVFKSYSESYVQNVLTGKTKYDANTLQAKVYLGYARLAANSFGDPFMQLKLGALNLYGTDDGAYKINEQKALQYLKICSTNKNDYQSYCLFEYAIAQLSDKSISVGTAEKNAIATLTTLAKFPKWTDVANCTANVLKKNKPALFKTCPKPPLN